jgi:hypothetical protein
MLDILPDAGRPAPAAPMRGDTTDDIRATFASSWWGRG